MAYLIALGVLSLAGLVATVWLVRTDGYGRIPTDPSRVASSSDGSRDARTLAAAPAVEAVRPSLQAPTRTGTPSTAPLRVVRAD